MGRCHEVGRDQRVVCPYLCMGRSLGLRLQALLNRYNAFLIYEGTGKLLARRGSVYIAAATRRFGSEGETTYKKSFKQTRHGGQVRQLTSS